MRVTTPRAICLALTLLAPMALRARAGQSGPTAVKAFYRQGQTFITWKEDSAAKGEWYKVYASDKPISNVKAATFIAKIPEGSRNYRWIKVASPKLRKSAFRKAKHVAKCFDGIQLEDDENTGKILPEGTGVFVRTIKKPGARYYAVTVEKGGSESAAVAAGVNSLKQAVKEKVAVPGAILVGKTTSNGYIYLFFTDFEKWNPDKIDDNWEGYAHLCYVRMPTQNKSGAKVFPLSVRLHAYAAWQDWMAVSGRDRVGLALLDYNLTWWYGFSDAKPKMEGSRFSQAPTKGIVHNFTEQRVLQAIRWLASKPKNCKAHVDPMRVHVYGGSMGGSGVNVFGMRHGEVFAGCKSGEGITNWALDKKYQGWSLAKHVGPQSRNDMTNEGVPVYEALNMPKWLGDHPEIETPYLDMFHGTLDYVIPFHSVSDYWRGLEKGKHPYSAGWDMFGHVPGMGSGGPMHATLICRDEALPAFANASCNVPTNSEFRLLGKCKEITPKTLTIKPGIFKKKNGVYAKDGSFPPDLAGKTLTLAPSTMTRKWWIIKSNTPTTITIEDGDMVAYQAPITGWTKQCFKRDNKREPNAEDLKALGEKKKKTFLICDGPPRGQRNSFFAWSSRNQNFDEKSKDDDIVDERDTFAISIRLEKAQYYGECKEDTATADVTPRRCQNFKPKSGAKVAWENLSFADPKNPKKIAGGEVTADKHGLVTVAKFQIGKKGWGNRLVLKLK